MKRHNCIVVVFLIVTACNGQINVRDESLNEEPDVGPLNNIAAPAEGVLEINYETPLLNELIPNVPELNEPPIVNANIEIGIPELPENNNDNEEPPLGDNLGENNNNVEQPDNNELPENIVTPPTEDNISIAVPPQDDNLDEQPNNVNFEPPKIEDPPTNINVIDEERPITEPPVNGGSIIENNNPPQSLPEVDNPSTDEVANPDDDNLNNILPPNDNGPANNGDQPNYLTPDKIEVPSTSEPSSTPGLSSTTSEVTEPPKVTPLYEENDNGHRPGNNGGGHGHHQRYRCRTRFGYMKIDGYCDKYVECKNYRPRRKVCPDGMNFNENARWSEYPCGYPSDVPCLSRNVPASYPQASPYCPHQYGFFIFDSQDVQERCSYYIMCSNGVPNIMKCPESLVFNVKVGRCDWPEQVPGCKGISSFKCPDEYETEDYLEEDLDVSVVRNYKHEHKCSYFWSCLRGQARMLRCDYGMIFDPNYGLCVVDEYGSCNEYYYPNPPTEENED